MIEGTILAVTLVMLPVAFILTLKYFKKWDNETFVNDDEPIND